MGEEKMGEKEPLRLSRVISRRNFLKGALGAGLAFLAGCGPTPEKPRETEPPEKPAVPSRVTEAPPTAIVEPAKATPVAQVTKIETVVVPTENPIVTYRSVPLVDQNFWKSAFAGIGGKDEKITLTPGPNGEKISGTPKDYLEYASLVFRRKIDPEDLTEDSLVALQFWSAMVQRMGIEGVTPDFSQVFSKLREFKGYRITLNNLSPGDGGKLEIVIKNGTPHEAIFRKKTHFTLWGVFTDKSGTFALGFFDEGFKREGKGESEVLYQYPVIIPLDSTEGSLKSFFEANGFSFETDKNEQGDLVLKLKRDGETFNLIPSRPDKELADLFKKKAGALWMDQKPDGTWYPNPVVPYLPEALEKLVGENYVVEKVVDKTGERVVAKDSSGKEIYEAKYNEKTNGWEWEKIVEKLAAPKINGLVYNEADKKYYAEKQNPYGLKENIYAGETIEYTFENEKTLGLVLTPEVIRVLMQKTNTPEVVAKQEWKIPFPLDARGESGLNVETWDPKNYRKNIFCLKGFSPQAVFLSPFSTPAEALLGSSPGYGLTVILGLPKEIAQDSRHSLNFIYPQGSFNCKAGSVSFGEPVVWGVKGLLDKSAPPGTQVISHMQGGDPKSDNNLTDNILEIEGKKVFLAGKR